MRRSAAPSFQNGGPGKRIKFNSPIITTKSSPTQLPLRGLNDVSVIIKKSPGNKLVEKENSCVHNTIVPKSCPILNHEPYPPVKSFNILYAKASKKKHKKWEGDGYLYLSETALTLTDEADNIITKKSLSSMVTVPEPGITIFMGGKEVQVMSERSPDVPTSTIILGSQVKTLFPRTEVTRPSPCGKAGKRPLHQKAFQVPLGSSCGPTNLPKARHNPQAENAVVLHHPGNGSECFVVLDPYLQRQMRSQQIEGVKFLYKCTLGKVDIGKGAILADAMGLGKTLQCIALIWTLLKQGPTGTGTIKRALVVCPASVIKNWKKEFMKWLGSERIKVLTVVSGDADVCDFLSSPLCSVLIIGYEMLRKSVGKLSGLSWGLIVCDEGHRLKNSSSKLCDGLRQLQCDRKVLVTGTPIQNNLKEFYTLANVVNPGVFGSTESFNSHFVDPIEISKQPNASASQKQLGISRSTELEQIILKFLIRRVQRDDETSLPTKTEHILFCLPTEEVKASYRKVADKILSSTSEGFVGVDILGEICKLRKICNHPCLLDVQKSGVHDVPVDDSTKLAVTVTLISDNIANRRKTILISNYTQTLDLMGHLCSAISWEFHRLDGGTPLAKRHNIVELFNSSYDKKMILLLSSKAGGMGLNLIGGSALILYDIDWNPANDRQAMARVWREGQRRPVHIYRLITTGTIEEKILQRQVKKENLSNAVIDKSLHVCSFSEAELADIFSYDFGIEGDCQTHQLLQCLCNGTYRPRKGEDVDAELMTWNHAHSNDPRISFQLTKVTNDITIATDTQPC